MLRSWKQETDFFKIVKRSSVYKRKRQRVSLVKASGEVKKIELLETKFDSLFVNRCEEFLFHPKKEKQLKSVKI